MVMIWGRWRCKTCAIHSTSSPRSSYRMCDQFDQSIKFIWLRALRSMRLSAVLSCTPLLTIQVLWHTTKWSIWIRLRTLCTRRTWGSKRSRRRPRRGHSRRRDKQRSSDKCKSRIVGNKDQEEGAATTTHMLLEISKTEDDEYIYTNQLQILIHNE